MTEGPAQPPRTTGHVVTRWSMQLGENFPAEPSSVSCSSSLGDRTGGRLTEQEAVPADIHT